MPLKGLLLLTEGTSVATSAFTAEQTASVKTALTDSANTVLQTFIDLLPIIALIVGVIFGIRFVKSQFNKVQKAK